MEEEYEEISPEDLLLELLERVNILEEVLGQVMGMQHEMSIDHQALFTIMRNSGKFSKDAFKTCRARIVREEVEESNQESSETLPEESDGD